MGNLLFALSEFDKDGGLALCAQVNTIISGFGPELTDVDRLQRAANLLCGPSEISAINKFASNYKESRNITVFFRGQILELARLIAAHGQDHSSAEQGVELIPAKRAFFRAALIASDLWSQRIFGERLSSDRSDAQQLERALGAFRKAMEEAADAPHPGIALGRGWLLFSNFLPARNSEFANWFEFATGLSIDQYFVCGAALMMYTFSNRQEGPFFRTDYVADDTAFKSKFDTFIKLRSQSTDDLSESSRGHASSEYKMIRQKPILNFKNGLSAIFDPAFYSDNLTVAPLFDVVSSKKGNVNEIFGSFGYAFEDYVNSHLRTMYPDGSGSGDRLYCNIKARAFEIDAILIDDDSAIVFEHKASWLREDQMLLDDYSKFIEELRRKYGVSVAGDERPKGVAQLAKITGGIVRREWRGNGNELSRVRSIYPILTVHDERMGAPGTGKFLDWEFRQLLGSVPRGQYVHSLIILTVGDLENLTSSVGPFSLLEFFRAYSVENPERMQSVHNYMALSKFSDMIVPSATVRKASEELMDVMMKELFSARAP